ncbi:MAG: hypothetical protein N2515_03615 [Deltaproteobacteria bacterium]|nr:hypothetical protein [Deltaproteobacteria bacterium]
MPKLPPCGIYRTIEAIGSVPKGRLVFFHNHGEPGPGIYLPEKWIGNKAVFSTRGLLLPSPEDTAKLLPLPREGFYRVTRQFHCCPKKCRVFAVDTLVQLGYDWAATPILFEPEWMGAVLRLPEEGTRIQDESLAFLAPLFVREASIKNSSTDELLIAH